MLADLLNRQKGSRGGGYAPNSHFRYIEEADIIVHPSINDWLCADLHYTGGEQGPGPKPKPVASVTFRAFLLKLRSRSTEQQSLVEFGPKGEVIFRIGRAQHEGEAVPVIHLCFPPRPESTHANEEAKLDANDEAVVNNEDGVNTRTVWCGCTKGACNNRRCVCFKSGLQCGIKCHGGKNKANANCLNKPSAEHGEGVARMIPYHYLRLLPHHKFLLQVCCMHALAH
jgi:hypothetical protein